MNREKYDLLVREMDTIARKVSLFPPELQDVVYEKLVATLLDEPAKLPVTDAHEASAGVSSIQVSPVGLGDRNYAGEIEEYYSKYGLSEYNDMEVSAWVCYYFTTLAPEEVRVESIDANHYAEVCTITGRKLPKNAGTTLNNSKNIRKYLESKGTGLYALSQLGKHFVINTMLKENEE
ncbi:MAG: hypothetical protein OXG53_02180 [Chloroflexi bacterium]|nr:hypothetical protein [Chloroflexota bacterium]